MVGTQKFILISKEDAFWKWKGIGGGNEAFSMLACKTESCLLVLSTFGCAPKETDMQILSAAATKFYEACQEF